MEHTIFSCIHPVKSSWKTFGKGRQNISVTFKLTKHVVARFFYCVHDMLEVQSSRRVGSDLWLRHSGGNVPRSLVLWHIYIQYIHSFVPEVDIFEVGSSKLS